MHLCIYEAVVNWKYYIEISFCTGKRFKVQSRIWTECWMLSDLGKAKNSYSWAMVIEKQWDEKQRVHEKEQCGESHTPGKSLQGQKPERVSSFTNVVSQIFNYPLNCQEENLTHIVTVQVKWMYTHTKHVTEQVPGGCHCSKSCSVLQWEMESKSREEKAHWGQLGIVCWRVKSASLGLLSGVKSYNALGGP